MLNNKKFATLDCTLRDGGYVNNWDFSLSFAKGLYASCMQAGVDIVELGFLGGKDDDPLWRRITAKEAFFVKQKSGPLISAMLEFDTVGVPLLHSVETGIDILRIALNKDKLAEGLCKMRNYREQGYMVFLQLMGITSYTDSELLQAVIQISESCNVDVIGIGDSYGSLLPGKTEYIVHLIKNNTDLKVGLHPHNNMQLGMANVLAAIGAGVEYVDASISGMGRGGGNVPIELLIGYFGKLYPEKYDVAPILNFIDEQVTHKLAQHFEWGYTLPSLLTGIYECHPYYASKLVAKREFTIPQILNAIKIISGREDVIGFSEELLTEIIEQKMLLSDDEREKLLKEYIVEHSGKVPYQNRYIGRKVLVLGNGPSLIHCKKQIQLFISQNNPVILGANNLGGIHVDYHAFNNQRRYTQFRADVSPDEAILLGPSVVPNLENGRYEEIICFNSGLTGLDIVNGVITSNCRSISVLLGAVAIVMGAEELYFAGMDGYLGGDSLFYIEDENCDNEYMARKHYENQEYISQLRQCAEEAGCDVFKSITETTYKF